MKKNSCTGFFKGDTRWVWIVDYQIFLVKSGLIFCMFLHIISTQTKSVLRMRKDILGWSKDPGPTKQAGRLPAIFSTRRRMKELSIFVDESGDFGEYMSHAPYYIVSMVLHDQSRDISAEITKLNSELTNLGYGGHVVHTEPLIRREEDYRNLSPKSYIFSRI